MYQGYKTRPPPSAPEPEGIRVDGAAGTRIPFFDYDQRLFRLLAAQGGGRWDNSRQEFIFRGNINAELAAQMLPGVPFVQVEEQSPVPPRVFGFFEASRIFNAKSPSQSDSNFLTGGPLALPDKFSEHWRIKLEETLRSRKYSPRTLRSYIYYNRLLCQTLQKPPEEIQSEDITRFLAAIEKNKECSASSMNLAISAIKFFYKHVVKNDISKDQYRPRQDKRLPVVLSKADILNIFALEKNLKHRLLLMIVYASGLRVSEAVCLKRQDIDINRKSIAIFSGKGRKDRYSIMSETVINTLNNYYSQYDISGWLFPGTDPGKHLSIRTAQRIFEHAAEKANVQKEASIHSLRHSFATHLLENGTDIRYIKDLLGHTSIRTTERYTHVAHCKIFKIVSPLDNIQEKE
jgi:site-specific recombinase XerD